MARRLRHIKPPVHAASYLVPHVILAQGAHGVAAS